MTIVSKHWAIQIIIIQESLFGNLFYSAASWCAIGKGGTELSHLCRVPWLTGGRKSPTWPEWCWKTPGKEHCVPGGAASEWQGGKTCMGCLWLDSLKDPCNMLYGVGPMRPAFTPWPWLSVQMALLGTNLGGTYTNWASFSFFFAYPKVFYLFYF